MKIVLQTAEKGKTEEEKKNNDNLDELRVITDSTEGALGKKKSAKDTANEGGTGLTCLYVSGVWCFRFPFTVYRF